jgi:hypothetical protein
MRPRAKAFLEFIKNLCNPYPCVSLDAILFVLLVVGNVLVLPFWWCCSAHRSCESGNFTGTASGTIQEQIRLLKMRNRIVDVLGLSRNTQPYLAIAPA